MSLFAVLIAVIGLPACASMPAPNPTPVPGCFYDGHMYSPGQLIHRTVNGDCIHTLTCAEGGYPIAGDSRGCFRHKREATENAGPSPPQEPETPPEPLVPSLPSPPQEPETPPEPLVPSLPSPPQEPETSPEPLVPSLPILNVETPTSGAIKPSSDDTVDDGNDDDDVVDDNKEDVAREIEYPAEED